MRLTTQAIYELIYQPVNELCAEWRSTIGQHPSHDKVTKISPIMQQQTNRLWSVAGK